MEPTVVHGNYKYYRLGHLQPVWGIVGDAHYFSPISRECYVDSSVLFYNRRTLGLEHSLFNYSALQPLNSGISRFSLNSTSQGQNLYYKKKLF